ncbi:MAG: hypothetical protein ACI87E_002986 [Mariniblastus sp.]|jgi:hypothetical protein
MSQNSTPLPVQPRPRAGQPPRFLQPVIGFAVAALLGLVLTPSNLPAAQSIDPNVTTKIQIGLGGHVRLGKWIPVFVELPANVDAVRFETEVLDGDDTPVVYSGNLIADERQAGRFQAWTRLGRSYGGVKLRLFDATGKLVEDHEIQLRGPNLLAELRDSTCELILTLEPSQIFQQAIEGVSSVASRGQSREVTAIGDAQGLPLNKLGYDSIKTVLLVTSDLERVDQISEQQLVALDSWVKDGGTLIFSVAKNADRLLANNGKLARFFPGKFSKMGTFDNSSRLETFCDSREALIERRGKPLPISEVDSLDGRIVVNDGNDHALIIRGAKGFGQVVVTTFDLDSTELMEWKGFTNLISRLVAGADKSLSETGGQRSSRGNSVSHYGYQDLIGQLRVPLDRFSKVQFVKFALIAALIVLYILCIGPGDYFLLSKVFKKMELTWLTFPLVSLLFCCLAVGIARMTRPNNVQLNQLEIIDIDAVEGRIRGSVWTNLYSPRGENCTLELDRKHGLGFDIDSNLMTWHGLPGDGLGGMMTSANPGLLKTSYEQQFESDETGKLNTKTLALPLQVSSTKPFFTRWWADSPIQIRSGLKLNPRLHQLNGTFKNPFKFPLRNVRLVFEDSVFVLDEPILGSEILFDVQTESSEKNLRSLLTRKIVISKSDRGSNSPWNPTDTRVDRIADMLMFYGAAGGANYTGLTHDYQPLVDMSNYRDLKRAILIAEVDKQAATMILNGKNVSEQYDNTTTIIRVVLPVDFQETGKRK